MCVFTVFFINQLLGQENVRILSANESIMKIFPTVSETVFSLCAD